MNNLFVETPCIRSASLSRACGRDVYLKLENTQPSGSFKNRGIGTLCLEASKSGAKLLVSSSGGNAGLAAAYAGRILSLTTRVIVPESTPEFMRQKIRDEGADVAVHGKIWDEANELALSEVRDRGAFYIPPFDHPSIWKGNSTIVDELVQQVATPAAVVLAVGGGGLLLGVLEGLKRHGWTQTTVLACETEGTASFAASLKSKKLVSLATVTGAATSLGARTVSKQVISWFDTHPLQSFVTGDESAIRSVLRFLEDHRSLVEPACGAALSPVYLNKLENVPPTGPVVVIVCGGAVVSLEKISKWEKSFA